MNGNLLLRMKGDDCLDINCTAVLNDKVSHRKPTGEQGALSSSHTTKFSLTSSSVALLARVYNEQVFPHKFS